MFFVLVRHTAYDRTVLLSSNTHPAEQLTVYCSTDCGNVGKRRCIFCFLLSGHTPLALIKNLRSRSQTKDDDEQHQHS